MIDPAHTFKHAGLAVRILYEEYTDDNDNPRKNQDGNIGQMFCEHPHYTLGDEDAEDPREQTIDCPECNGSGEGKLYDVVERAAYGRVVVTGPLPTLGSAEMYIALHPEAGDWIPELQDCPKCEGNGSVELSITDWLRDVKKARVALPLFLYDHSGLAMTCGANLLAENDNFQRAGRFVGDDAGWDTSSVGLIYFDPELAERWGCPEYTDEEIEAQLRDEVRYYDAYLQGQVYGYEVIEPELDEDGEFDPASCEGEVLDSCWGFLEVGAPWSDDSGVMQEAKASADACRKQLDAEKAEAHKRACAEKAEAHKWACADVVTV